MKMNPFTTLNKLTTSLILFIPACVMIFTITHIYSDNNENYLVDRLLPIIVTVFLLIYLTRQHLLYWDKSFFKKPYFSLLNGVVALLFGLLLLVTLYSLDLKLWYEILVPSSSSFLFLPFIISGYVIPLLLFSHVFADSLEMTHRIKYIAAAYLIIIICFLFYWLRYSDTIAVT